MPEYRSFSQWSDMNTCPYSYQLKRVDKVSQTQAAWTAQGTAVHKAMEVWERSGREEPVESVQQVFREEYAQEIEDSMDLEPSLSRWFSSGPYSAEKDIPRRRELGVEQIEKSINWYRKHPEQVPWTHPDGRLGIELPFRLQLASVQVRGYIDWIGRLSSSCELGPRDLKTGRKPGNPMQLKLYDLAIDDHYQWRGDIRPGGGVGDFFMTRTGKPTVAQSLDQVSRSEVELEFHTVDVEIKAGNFPANPGEHCKFCPVRRSCKYREV